VTNDVNRDRDVAAERYDLRNVKKANARIKFGPSKELVARGR
jgi:hypothetical protein